jgi:hypothetical protein
VGGWLAVGSVTAARAGSIFAGRVACIDGGAARAEVGRYPNANEIVQTHWLLAYVALLHVIDGGAGTAEDLQGRYPIANEIVRTHWPTAIAALLLDSRLALIVALGEAGIAHTLALMVVVVSHHRTTTAIAYVAPVACLRTTAFAYILLRTTYINKRKKRKRT